MKPVIPFLRAMGIRLSIFLDNILIMASSHELAMRHTDFVIWGLSSLGFVINKIHSHPFKGVAIPRLRSKLRSYQAFLARRRAFKSKSVCSGNHAPSSHCKLCNKYKFSWSLSVNHACDSRNPPSHQDITEEISNVDRFSPLKQWRRHDSPTSRHNVFCNVSKIGWGAHLDSILIGGRWLKKRGQFPVEINFSGTKSSIPSVSGSCSISQGPYICFSRDNCMAMSHISKLGGGGGGHSVSNTVKSSKRIMELCPEQKPNNFSLPGKLNVLADHKSSIFKHSTEWMLNPSIFRGVVASPGRPDKDLFASRVNHQIPEFVSW